MSDNDTAATEAKDIAETPLRQSRVTENRNIRSWLLRTKWFERLSHWAFGVCDGNSTGRINKDELYAGVLLVHVNLAKYAGPAACYPPSRTVVEGLFSAVDKDQSGQINQEEFAHILRVCSVHIASRIFVYYAILILLVPKLADAIVDGMLYINDKFIDTTSDDGKITTGPVNNAITKLLEYVETILTWNQIAERIVGLLILFSIIPIIFEWIDQRSTQTALKMKSSSSIGENESDNNKSKTE